METDKTVRIIYRVKNAECKMDKGFCSQLRHRIIAADNSYILDSSILS